MGQKEALGNSQQASESFVELHIEDLVKDRLLWQAQVGRRATDERRRTAATFFIGLLVLWLVLYPFFHSV